MDTDLEDFAKLQPHSSIEKKTQKWWTVKCSYVAKMVMKALFTLDGRKNTSINNDLVPVLVVTLNNGRHLASNWPLYHCDTIMLTKNSLSIFWALYNILNAPCHIIYYIRQPTNNTSVTCFPHSDSILTPRNTQRLYTELPIGHRQGTPKVPWMLICCHLKPRLLVPCTLTQQSMSF